MEIMPPAASADIVDTLVEVDTLVAVDIADIQVSVVIVVQVSVDILDSVD